MARKRRPPKEKQHLRIHAARRLNERYGIPKHEIEQINQKVLDGDAEFLWRESGTRTHWLVKHMERDIIVVYFKPAHHICTVLPPEAMEEYAKHV